MVQQDSVLADFKAQTRVIDMHTHMFNARYLPLRGIFKSFGIGDSFNRPLAWICWLLTDYTKFPKAVQKMPTHLDDPSIAKIRTSELREAMIASSYIEALASNCEEIIRVCSEDHVFKDEYEFLGTQSDGDLKFEELSTQKLAVGAIYYSLEALGVDTNTFQADLFSGIDSQSKIASYPFKDLFKNFFREAFSKIEHAIDYLDFVWNLSQSEKQIYLRLQAFYETLDVDCHFVHHMMDMSHPYIKFKGHKKYGKTKLPYYASRGRRSQLSQMQDLSQYAAGNLTGFSAFDPWRFSKSKNIRQSVKDAMDEAVNVYHMKGFKFYPPMGYRPDENNSADIQKAIDTFFDYCVDHSFPVFTHCTPSGFQVEKKSGLNSDPEFWRQMIKKNKSREKLKLCFGHAGGGRFEDKKIQELISGGWVSGGADWNSPGNYAKEIVRLCRNYPNVYCELANIDSILTIKCHAENLKANLSRELNSQTSGTYPFSKKIMYGTDWHMVGMVNDVMNYYSHLSDVFDSEDLRGFKKNFFYENAKNFLNL